MAFAILLTSFPVTVVVSLPKYTESAKPPKIIALELELFEQYYCDFSEDIEF